MARYPSFNHSLTELCTAEISGYVVCRHLPRAKHCIVYSGVLHSAEWYSSIHLRLDKSVWTGITPPNRCNTWIISVERKHTPPAVYLALMLRQLLIYQQCIRVSDPVTRLLWYINYNREVYFEFSPQVRLQTCYTGWTQKHSLISSNKIKTYWNIFINMGLQIH